MGASNKAFEVWGDSRVESEWFQRLDRRLLNCPIYSIGQRTTNPSHIEQLVEYDRPDIIVCREGRPILVLEKTREVPTGHNIGQRLGRIVRALECKVPALTLLPFRARKHGTYTGICEINVRVLRAAIRMGSLHSMPCLFLEWPVDGHGELIGDGSEALGIRQLCAHALDGRLVHSEKAVDTTIAIMKARADLVEAKRPQYGRPPASVAIDCFPAPSGNSGKRSVCVYTIEMTAEACRREDPYTGMQFLYDYLYCRTGVRPTDRHTALVLHFPKLTRQIFEQSNPNDPSRKSSLWYAIADELWFSDEKIVLR